MMLRILIPAVIGLLFSCTSNENMQEAPDPADTAIVNSSVKTRQQLVNLDHGFFVEFSDERREGSTIVYHYMRLSRNTGVVLIDSTFTYLLEDKIFPMVIPKPDDRFEILMEVNNGTENNFLHWIFVEGDKFMNSSTLPLFVSRQFDLNKDGVFEFAGFTHFTEPLVRDGQKFTQYNPLLFYRITQNGLVLDSALTIERNKLIYGDFYGFVYNRNIEVPTSSTHKFDEEIRRIKKMAVTQ
jgi:hypothetical protein